MMKILMTTDSVGGIWNYSLELAAALSRSGVRIILATMGPPPSAAQIAAASAVPDLSLRLSTYALEWMPDPWEDVARAGEWLLDIDRAERPDVIHLNHFAFGPLPWLAPAVMVAHGCALSWWTAVHRTRPPAELNRYRDAVRRGLTAADLVIAPTASLVEMMRPHYLRFPHARVIYHAVSPAPFRSDILPGDRAHVVFSAGRLWDEGRNFGALRTIAETLEWPVRVAGLPANSHQRGGGAGNIEGAGSVAAGRIQALGVLEPAEVAAEMKRASVYVLPALYEPFGLSAMEAAHAGCALVLGDIPTLREVWQNAAVFVAPDDVRSLHTAVDTLMRDEGLRTCLADRAYQRALCFRTSDMAASYMDAYAAVAHSRELLV